MYVSRSKLLFFFFKEWWCRVLWVTPGFHPPSSSVFRSWSRLECLDLVCGIWVAAWMWLHSVLSPWPLLMPSKMNPFQMESLSTIVWWLDGGGHGPSKPARPSHCSAATFLTFGKRFGIILNRNSPMSVLCHHTTTTPSSAPPANFSWSSTLQHSLVYYTVLKVGHYIIICQ